jgi:hypothetical protein
MQRHVFTGLLFCFLTTAFVVRAADSADSTALEKAVAEFSQFLHNKPYGNNYFNGIEQKENRLKIKFLRSYDDYILDKIEKVLLTKEDGIYKITIAASRDCYYDSKFERYYSKQAYFGMPEKDSKRFYLLFGNLLDEYRLATNKKYRIRKTYAEKLAIITSPGFRTEIPSGAIVQVLDIPKSEPAYKSLKKLIGTEIQVYGLQVNDDTETYSGSIRKDAINSYTVNSIRVRYVYGTPNSILRIAPSGDFCTKANFMIRKMADNALSSLIPYANLDKAGWSYLISDLYFDELPEGSFLKNDPDMVGFFKKDMKEEAANELMKSIDGKITTCLGVKANKKTDTPDLKNYYYTVPLSPGDAKKVLLLLLFNKNLNTGYYEVRLDFANF